MQVSRRDWFLFMCIVLLAAANVSVYRVALAPRELEVSVFDVGEKGRAALARTPDNMTVLINAGPDARILRALGGALPPWQRQIDAVILTSTASALIGGLPDVEQRYRIGSVVRVGNSRVPYGTALALDDVRIIAISPDVFSVSSGTFSLLISSTTPVGVYGSGGSRPN